jgi:S1 RNA binding domain
MRSSTNARCISSHYAQHANVVQLQSACDECAVNAATDITSTQLILLPFCYNRTFTEGTSIDEILVLEVTRAGTPMLSLKPLLLAAQKQGTSGPAAATLPSITTAAATATSDDSTTATAAATATASLQPGDVAAGVVSSVQDFGVFVKFKGGMSALCPRALVADQFVKDPRGMFRVGDSARYVLMQRATVCIPCRSSRP